MSVPKNSIFLKAAQKTLENLKKNNCKTAHHGFEFTNNKLVSNETTPLMKFDHEILGLSGPPVLQMQQRIVLSWALLIIFYH